MVTILSTVAGLLLGALLTWCLMRELMKATVNGAIEKFANASHEQLKRNEVDFVALSQSRLEPLTKDLRDFRDKTVALKSEINTLMRQSEKMSDEAKELSKAIRGDSQVIGAWGEMQLRRILEKAGLEEGVGFTYQEAFASEGSLRKDLRTDVLVKMPGERWVVIDSKNTVESYVQYKNATDETTAEAYKEEILRSVKGHIDELKAAKYGKNIKNAFEYVLAYIPFEEVYLLAVKGLFDYAWENKVILVNASILMPALKLIELMWRGEDVDRKAQEVLAAAEGLADKFRIVLESHKAIGKGLSGVVAAYNTSINQMTSGKGNLLKRFQDLHEYGIEAAKSLPEELPKVLEGVGNC